MAINLLNKSVTDSGTGTVKKNTQDATAARNAEIAKAALAQQQANAAKAAAEKAAQDSIKTMQDAKFAALYGNNTPTSAAPTVDDTAKKKNTLGSAAKSVISGALTGGIGSYDGGGGGGSDYSAPSAASLLAQNYNNAVKNINSRYDFEANNIAQQSEDALRQAYINYMMSRKNMDTDMSRQGYTGGLTESNRARMYNNYGNIRNDLVKQREQQLEEQRIKRNNELYQILAQYNNQLARELY